MDAIRLQQERHKLIQDWARYTAERLVKSLHKKGIGVTGSLAYSILYHLIGIAGGDVSGVKHEFNAYGKMVDMGVGRGQKIESVKGNADIIRLIGEGRRPKKWLTRTYYAEVQELLSLLSIKYGEQATGIIKEQITLKIVA